MLIKPARYMLFGLIVCFSCVNAQDEFEEAYGEEEWIDLATGTKKSVQTVPAVTTIITSKDIKRLGATNLDEILETIPGMHIAFSPLRAQSIYTIRGFGSSLFNSQVLTLVDGIPIDTAINGGRPNGFRLPVANIERIEVIRGPGSAVHGVDAYAGVINIISKQGGDSPETEIGARVGSYNTNGVWVTHGGNVGGWDLYAGIEYQGTSGDEDRVVIRDLQTNLDGLFGTSASLAPGPLDTEYQIVDSRIRLSKENWDVNLFNLEIFDAGQGAGVAKALDPAGSYETSILASELVYRDKNFSGSWDLTAKVSYLHIKGETDFQILPPDTTVPIGADGNLFTLPSTDCPDIGPNNSDLCLVTFSDGIWGNPDMEEDHYRFETVSVYDGIDRHRLRFAIGASQTVITASETKNFGPGVIDGTTTPIDGTLTDVSGTDGIYLKDGEQERTVKSISLQDEWKFHNDWELTTGVRYDDFSDFGSTTNPRVALVWETSYTLTTKMLYGKAFRAPSIMGQFAVNNPVSLGNENLGPETISTIELVMDYRPNFDTNVILNIYQYDADDLIQFIPEAGTGNSIAANTEGQKGTGFELEVDINIGDSVVLATHYSHVKTEDKATLEEVADVPTQLLFLDLSWKINDGWQVSGQFNFVGGHHRQRKDRIDNSELDTRDEMDEFSTVDLVVSTSEQYSGWGLKLGSKNLFDADTRSPSPAPGTTIPGDFPGVGRSVYAELSYLF